MKGREHQPGDRIGAKAVRESIFSVLPSDFVEEAQNFCHATLKKGDGVPLADRIGKAVGLYAGLGIGLDRLEAKIGKARGQWDAQTVADLSVWYTSITRDGVDAASLIPELLVVDVADFDAPLIPGGAA